MKSRYPREFTFQIIALVVAVILVHSLYQLVVRPHAAAVLLEQRSFMEADPNYIQERSVWVTIRDFEQESCFVLMLWALAIMGFKAQQVARERKLLEQELIPVAEGSRILPEDAREYTRQLQSLPEIDREGILPRALQAGLQRFAATRNIQDVSSTAHGVGDVESERLDSELSMVRYIAWAIPSIGFIGTVRGIGDALELAHKAVKGDIASVTQSLGVAFNSTFIALLISIVLTFLLHQLQLQQERLVLDAQTYVDRDLIQHLQVPSED